MNIRETLTAYLDGTLSDQEKRWVAQQLATTDRWRREYDRLRDMRRELQNTMPLMGRPQDGQLAALLPSILENVRPQTQHIDYRMLAKRTFMAGAAFLTMVLLPVIFMQLTGSAYAAVQRIENVPSVTNTPAAQTDSTAEADLEAVTRYYQVGTSGGFGLGFASFASPAPPPDATAIPSLEAN